MKTKITLLAVLLMLFSSIFYSQDFNTVPAKPAVYDSLPGMKWHSETPMPEITISSFTGYYLKKGDNLSKPDTGYIYSLGGWDKLSCPNIDLYKYNIQTHKWIKKEAKIPFTLLYGIHSVQLGNKIYIPATLYYDPSRPDTYPNTPELFIYDMEADTLRRGANMLANVCDYAIGSYGDSLIYLIGKGTCGPPPYALENIQIYNVRTNNWVYGEGHPIRERSSYNGTICGNKIVLVGGRYEAPGNTHSTSWLDIGTIDPNDPYKITWTTGEDFPSGPRRYIQSGSWNGKNNKYVFFTGGYSDSECFNDTWVYDIEKNKWLKIANKTTPTSESSKMTPLIRNDSVYLAILGGENYYYSSDSAVKYNINEWLYIGPNDALTADYIDVAPTSLDVLDTVIINEENTLKASFRNRGLTSQTFNATLKIIPGNYNSTKTINSLTGSGEIQLLFDKWIPNNSGAYIAQVYTTLSGDENAGNDTIISNFTIQSRTSPLWHAEAGISDSTENLEAVYYLKKSGNPSIADTGYIIVFADLWEEGDGYSRGSISKYNTVTRNWSAPDSSFIWVRYYHPVLLGGKVYFIGGQVEGTTCIYCGNELTIYDIEKDSVYYGSPMLKQCDSYAIGTFADSLIYILGGYSYDNNVQGEYNGFLNLAQIYNVNTDTWSYGTPFPGIRRCKISGSISGSTVVLAGGYSEQGDASTVDIGVIDPADPSILNWWQKPFLNQMNLENFPGGKTQGLASGAWFGRDTKAVYFAEGRKIWQYNVSTGVFSEMPEKVYTTDKLSALMPIVRNDSVYLAMIGRDKVTRNITNEWYYIGNDAADPDIANEEEPNLTAPKEYSLSQNYPNPFNPSTKIKYSLREPGHVSLTVYDMLGREIKTLINEIMSSGEHEVIFNVAELNLSSGIYLYRIRSGSFVQTKKLMLIK